MTTAEMTVNAPTGQMIGLLSENSFTQLVNAALRNYHSTLALSRSALANSALVTPTLVKDELSATAEERGQGLRLVLQWAVQQIAPGPIQYPLGEYRPLDDPAWRDSHWWRYNLLRHRYLEPLHPDDFVGDGRYTESLLALTGISSVDAFYDERNRAIREVADQLRQQLIDGQANNALQQLALQAAMLPLKQQGAANDLLHVAATFDDIFPRSLLLEMAQAEQIINPNAALEQLLLQRFLLAGDKGDSLWLSAVVRTYVYAYQSKPERQRRHRSVAAYYETQGNALLAAKHWLRAAQDAKALAILMPAVDDLIHELQIKELIELLERLEPRQLSSEQIYQSQLLLSDLYQRSGHYEEALTACRRALKASTTQNQQARVYRRMGKFYEVRNQMHALRYYQYAVDRFATTDPELAEVLKDRGWLYYIRQEWTKAKDDLQQALQVASENEKSLQADIFDAMASLSRATGDLNQALSFAERTLAMREETGDLLRIARSKVNLGLLYRAMGEYRHAIAAYEEGMVTYQKINNQEVIATVLLNIGAAYYLSGNKYEAMNANLRSLAICQEIGLPLVELKARYNLAEVFAELDRRTEAATHWLAGYQLCQKFNFDDQLPDFLTLRNHSPALQGVGIQEHTEIAPASSILLELDEEEGNILQLAQREQSITAKRLMETGNVSRATATRRLTALAEKGYLEKRGEGRGTYYVLAQPPTPIPAQESQPHHQRIRTQLAEQQARLAAEYGVTALDLAQATVPTLTLNVRFAALPSLEKFFALEEHLSTQLGMLVDLKPRLS